VWPFAGREGSARFRRFRSKCGPVGACDRVARVNRPPAPPPPLAPRCRRKVLEIDFVPTEGPARGLRELTRTQLDALCTAARCTIISTMSNDHLDSYVLSESSLFVYPHKIILKTCGTTTLLMVLPLLREYTAALGMAVEWVAYTRKDFQRPGQQQFPHRDPAEEVRAGCVCVGGGVGAWRPRQ
jgi:hypothetical protein